MLFTRNSELASWMLQLKWRHVRSGNIISGPILVRLLESSLGVLCFGDSQVWSPAAVAHLLWGLKCSMNQSAHSPLTPPHFFFGGLLLWPTCTTIMLSDQQEVMQYLGKGEELTTRFWEILEKGAFCVDRKSPGSFSQQMGLKQKWCPHIFG